MDWSPQRLLHELQKGLRYRTFFPEGQVLDWRNPTVRLDVVAGTVTFYRKWTERFLSGQQRIIGTRGTEVTTLTIEVMPPADAEVPAPSASAPAASLVPRRMVSEAKLRQCLLDIVKNHPPHTPPLSEGRLIKKVEEQLGAPVPREHVLAVRNEVAPGFKNPRGRPRK